MRKFLLFLLVIMCVAVTVSAQTENDLKRHFEGKQVALKIDMPATKDVRLWNMVIPLSRISPDYEAGPHRNRGEQQCDKPEAAVE